MSHFSTILKNLVASGMTNTNAALVVLESFFEENDPESSTKAVMYRGNISDTKEKIAAGLISEDDVRLAEARVKASTLDLIKTVEDMQFDDAVVINYFAMLTPNPAKDPFFSPITEAEPPEEYPEDRLLRELEEETPPVLAEKTSSVAEVPKSDAKKPRSKQFWLMLAGGVIILGGVIYFILSRSWASSEESNGFSQTNQYATAPQPTVASKPQTPTVAPQTAPHGPPKSSQRPMASAPQTSSELKVKSSAPRTPTVTKQGEPPSPPKSSRLPPKTKFESKSLTRNKDVFVDTKDKPLPVKPITTNKAVETPTTPVTKPPEVVPTPKLAPQVSPEEPETTTKSVKTEPTKVNKPSNQSVVEKRKAPEIGVKSVADREKIEQITRRLGTVKNNIELKNAELEKSSARLKELIELAKKDPNQVAKKDEEKKTFMALSNEIKVLRSEKEQLEKSLPK